MSTQFTNRQWRLPNNENKDKQSNYSMDFASSRVNLGTSLNLGINSTISLWINTNILNYVILGESTNTKGSQTYLNGQSIYVKIGGTFKAFTHSMVTGQWYNIVVIRQGGSIEVFQNNTSLGTQTGYPTSINTLCDTIGAKPTGSSPYDGKINSVSFFDYALTDGTGGTVNQIAALYGSSSTGIGNPMSLSPKPVAYYPLGDQDSFNGSNYLVPNSSLKDYVFDFSSDYIDIGNQNELKNITELSVSLWFNYDSIATSADGLVARDSSSRVDGNWYVALDYNNSIRFLLKTANGQDALNSSTISVNKWYHTLCVWDGQNMKIYLNGSLDNSITLSNATGTLGNASDVVAIGRRFASGGFLNGKASNVQTFNTALSSTDAETLYNNGSPLTSMSGFTSLQGWWKLDASATYDGSNWTIEDSSSNSNDGTSSGMTQANLVQSDLSFTSGYSPYALDFDSASSDYIDCGNMPELNGVTQMSFSIWFNNQTPSNNKGLIGDMQAINFGYTNGRFHLIVRNVSGNDYSFRLYIIGSDSAQHSIDIDNRLFTSNEWYNLVVVYNAGLVNFYVDGSLAPSTITAGAPIPTSFGTLTYPPNKPLQIGSWTPTSLYWDGKISNASIWNAALTSAQVTEIYSEGIPQNLNNHSAVSSLVSWWQLGSNSSFNSTLNQWTCIDEKGTNTGESSQTFNEDAIIDGVGSYANGLSSGMGGDEVVGDAPYSTANSLSVNMDVLDRVTDTPS